MVGRWFWRLICRVVSENEEEKSREKREKERESDNPLTEGETEVMSFRSYFLFSEKITGFGENPCGEIGVLNGRIDGLGERGLDRGKIVKKRGTFFAFCDMFKL